MNPIGNPGTNGPIQRIKCTKCGTQYPVHKPEMLQLNGIGVSQVMLFSAVGLEERACPSCRTFPTPIIAEVNVKWARFEKQPDLAIPTTEQIRQLSGNGR